MIKNTPSKELNTPEVVKKLIEEIYNESRAQENLNKALDKAMLLILNGVTSLPKDIEINKNIQLSDIINRQDVSSGNTLLHMARFFRNDPVAEQLLQYGAKDNIKNIFEMSAQDIIKTSMYRNPHDNQLNLEGLEAQPISQEDKAKYNESYFLPDEDSSNSRKRKRRQICINNDSDKDQRLKKSESSPKISYINSVEQNFQYLRTLS